MLSFARLWEEIDRQANSPLMDSEDEGKAAQCIRAGLALRSGDGPSFWDDFMNLCSNTSGLADLLGVREEDVSHWQTRIQDCLDVVQRHDGQESGRDEEKKKMIPTGENGAVTDQNMGSFGKVK